MNIRNTVISLLDKGADSAANFMRLLADSAETSGENKKSDNAANGGVLNFRTDKLDDGTDAAGWYGDD